MFRHKETTTDNKSSSSQEEAGGVVEVSAPTPPTPSSPRWSSCEAGRAEGDNTVAAKTEPGLKELIEKNLKWSQIIYEQNRKINSKLLWASIFGWVKFIIFIAPLVLGIIYLQPILKSVWAQYNELLGSVPVAKGALKQGSLDNFFQLFNLDPAKQEQLKALLK